MTTKGRSAAPRQVLSERGNVRLGVMVVIMLMVVGMAVGQTCTKNLDCGRTTCIAGSCAVKSTPGGPCDANDNTDCSNTGSVCTSNICLSPVGGQCLANNQCVNPGVCIAKRCKAALSAAGGPCDDAGDCSTLGSTCTGSVCVNPTNPTCPNNAACTSPAVCVGNQCVAQSSPEGPCDESADCSVSGSSCTGGKCLSPSGGVCSSNGGCGSGQSCIGGLCANKSPASGPCDSNDKADCAVTGSACTSNTCYSPVGASCSANTECASPNTCLNGACRAKSSATGFCEEGTDCTVVGSTCTASKCISPSGGACPSNAGCQSTQVCVSQRCVNKASPGGSCDDASDCFIAGSTCSAGACTSPSGSFCTANRHCTSPSDVCVAQSCVAKRNPGQSCDETADCAGTTVSCINAVCRLPVGASCGTDNNACAPPSTCRSGTCQSKSSVLGPCDTNDGGDCVLSGSSCEAGVCKSPINAPCNSNSYCATPNTCYRSLCKAKAIPSGPCDPSDNADCVEPSACTNSICLSLVNSNCNSNSDCASPSLNSCIGGVCLAKAGPGATCDTNDDLDCKVRNSVCSGGTCLSPYQGTCSGDSDCAAGTCPSGFCETNPPALYWEGYNALPIPLEEFSAVAVDTSIWVMGGFNSATQTASKRVFEYDTDQNLWYERTPLPIVSYTHVAVLLPGTPFIYLIGGRTSQSALHNRVLKYDTTGNSGMGSVVKLPELLPNGYGLIASSAVVMQDLGSGNNFIVTFGGLQLSRTNNIFTFDTSSDNSPWNVAYFDVNSFSPETNNLLPQPLTYITANVVGDYAYIMGGNVDGEVVDINSKFDPTVTAFPSASYIGTAVQQVASLPVPRYFHSSFEYQNKIYLLGGASSSALDTFLVTIDVYDPDLDEWTTLDAPPQTLPSERISVQAALVGSKVYLIGGKGTTSLPYVEVFDLDNLKWLGQAVPQASEGAAVAAINGNIVVAAGVNRLGVRQTDTQIFDTDINNWTEGAPIPLPIVNGLGVTDGSFLYVIGGSILVPATAEAGETVAITGKVQVYNPDFDLWIPSPSLPDPMPFPRRQACGAYDSNSNSIFVFGGTDISGRASNITQVFSVADGTWSVLPLPVPSPIKMCSAVTFNGKIYLVGGRDDANALRTQILAFNPSTLAWDRLVYPEITAYENPMVSVLNDFIIIVGGGLSFNPAANPLRTTYAFDPVSRAIFRLDDAPTPRYNGGAVTIDDVLYVVGGRFSNNIISSVEKLYID